MLELRTERPPTAPTQLSKHLIFSAAASATARQAPPRERFDSHLSLLILEERWANLAQLFTFYWDLTRNKFSFLPSSVPIRSPLINLIFTSADILDLAKLWRRILWNIGRDQEQWMKWMEGSQTPGSETTHHITYCQGGDIGVLQKLLVISNMNMQASGF